MKEHNLTQKQVDYITIITPIHFSILNVMNLNGNDLITCLEFMLDVARQACIIDALRVDDATD